MSRFHENKSLLPALGLWLDASQESQPIRWCSRSFELWSSVHMVSATRECVRILYSGRVQGVGFRYTAKTVAQGFEVTGIVRNLPDGTVELIAEGQRPELEEFLQAVRDSGLGSCIRDEQADWKKAEGRFKGFEIVR